MRRETTRQGAAGRPGGATRRQFLLGGAAAGVGAAAAIGIDRVVARAQNDEQPQPKPERHGASAVSFYGEHQAGIATDAQAHATLLGFDLLPDVDRGALRRMMRLLSDDAARLTAGEPALADTEPELAGEPARLTVTFGFGRTFVERTQTVPPEWLAPLPSFGIDELRDEFSGGDLLIQVAADDPLTVSHTVRMLSKDARSFATLRWSQQGFRRAYGTTAPGTTMRNLFGQVDGTTNPRPSDDHFDRIVWNREGWLAGGSGVVIRRIRMNLDTWDRADRQAREFSVGRTLDSGAPLTGENEHDEPDFDAKGPLGFPMIDDIAHIRRARTSDPTEKIFRRVYNYDVPSSDPAAVSDSGLLFISFQADVARQFTPLQRRLAEGDLLNIWTTPIGSAVFAIPPGCGKGGYIGETLLET